MNTLKFLLRGLFSNEVIIKEGRKQKWWLTVLVLLLSILISLIPAFVSILNTNGSAVITNSMTQNVDYSLERFSFEYLNGDEAKIVLKIEDGKMKMEEGKTFSDIGTAKKITIKGDEEISYIEIGRENQTTMLISYIDFSVQKNPVYNNINEKMVDVRNALAVSYPTAEPKDSEGFQVSKMYTTLLFTEDFFYFHVYPNDATTKFLVQPDGTLSLKETASASGMTGVYSDVETRNRNLTTFFNSSMPSQTMERWKTFFDQAYQPTKMSNLMLNSIIYASLNVLVVLIMALTVVIMSRFKSAQCGKVGFGGALKLITFATLCPSLLAMLLAFIVPTMQSIGFLMFVGFRCIFLSTRLTRGEMANAPAEKESQKKK